ncbi:beta-1,4-galactosyltransferase galt-1-like isoform X2 [Anabas testudineus]|uniref:beta-1,4-galactosyltransferase galt-1-like isoform X2 n=1 Tax=Anabas testudineus TaxID=64144 RepID=UPI000E45FCD7|nr:beta-1,4-galactosyltransferase galt-1-like isoform X2 [Anabas testudineus]
MKCYKLLHVGKLSGSKVKTSGIYLIFGSMDRVKHFKRKFFLLLIAVFILIIIERTPRIYRLITQIHGSTNTCPFQTSNQSITPLENTKHFLVSAYMDQRVKGFDIRIIGIFRRDSIQTLYCLFCCAGHLSTTTPAAVLVHSDHFGFPFGTTDIMCKIPTHCNAVSHVTLLTQPNGVEVSNHTWLLIRNKKTDGKEKKTFQFDFTVCISTLFGEYNNVLQFAQTLEMYRLLGVGRVVIYNTSAGPELNRLLKTYSEEGLVEMVEWPIHKHLNPSNGWLFSKHGGDLHYYGQLVTLNDCIYRSMDRSRYVLLNDIDEIIMPYQHDNLKSMMDMLQQQHPDAAMFHIESHVFPYKFFTKGKDTPLPRWRGVPGFNILERIVREDPDKNIFNPRKMIIQPRLVEQTSVHDVLKMFGRKYKVPMDVCRMIHCPTGPQNERLFSQHKDTRLWDFKDKVIPRVNEMLRRGGLL